MALDGKKVTLIQVARQQLCLTDDDYRTVLKRLGGVDSSKDLDLAGFKAVMAFFESCGFKSTSKKKNFGDRPGMASPGQVAMIRRLWAAFTAGEGTDASLGKWLYRQFKVSAIRFVNTEVAPKAITALKAMAKKRAEAPAAPTAPASPGVA